MDRETSQRVMPKYGACVRAAVACWPWPSPRCRKRNPLVFFGCVSLLAVINIFASSSGGLRGLLLTAASPDQRDTIAENDARGNAVIIRKTDTDGHSPKHDINGDTQRYHVHQISPYNGNKKNEVDTEDKSSTMVPPRPLVEAHPAVETETMRFAGRGFPWPERKNVVPNYFTYRGNSTTSTAKEVRFDIASSVLVYLHHNKAAGTTTKNCLSTVSKAGIGRHIGPIMTSEGRLAVELRFARNRHFMMKSMPNTYFGGYAFGVCDRFWKPCAYFTVMRDPYERTLSSHQYCKRARPDQLCAAQVASNVSLREWALHQGSFFFRQLLFQPEFCSDRTEWVPYINVENFPHQFLRSRNSLRGAPCWFREKLIMNLTLTPAEHETLLIYCLDNLERWFALIMLVDHYDESLKMADEAFKLPMYDLCSGLHANTGAYNKTAATEKSKILQKGTNDAKPSTSEVVKKQLLELRNDPEVQRVLRADDLLYKKGVEIFNRQREVFNKMKTRT